MASNGNTLYEFGPYRLDPGQRLLLRNGDPVPLQPKVFETLLLLVQNNERVVLKDDLLSTIWPNTFVEESNLSQNIFVLRKTLGDGVGAGTRRYIQTVPGRGYRFAERVRMISEIELNLKQERVRSQSVSETRVFVDVLDVAPSPAAEPAPEQRVAVAATKPRFSWKPVVWVAAVTLVLASGALLYRLIHPRPPRVLDFHQVAHSSNLDPYGRIQTDGSRLFYLDRDGDHWNSMQVAAAGGDSQPFLSAFRNTKLMAISPDNAEMLVASFTARTGDLPLWIMPLVGGSPRRVGDILANDATFSPDGKKILYSTKEGVFVTDLLGTSQTKLAPCQGDCSALAWSPDGKRIRYTENDLSTDRTSLWEIPSTGGTPRPFLAGWNNPPAECCGRWTPDGRYFIFTSIQNGGKDIWALREGNLLVAARPVQLTFGPFDYHQPLPSKDGHTIYVAGGQMLAEMVRLDPVSQTVKPLLDGKQAWELSFSADGKLIFYFGDTALWRSNADGTNAVKLLENSRSSAAHHLQLAPDGKQILLERTDRGSPPNYYLLSIDGGALKPVPQVGHPFVIPDFSPDGDTLAFGPDAETAERDPNHVNLWTLKLSTGEKREIPGSEGLAGGRWSPDGRYFAAMSADLKSIKILDVAKSSWSTVATGTYLHAPFWAADSRSVYFQDLLVPGEPIYRFTVRDQKVERAFSFEELLHSGFGRCALSSLTPDGSPILRLHKLGGGGLYALHVDLP